MKQVLLILAITMFSNCKNSQHVIKIQLEPNCYALGEVQFFKSDTHFFINRLDGKQMCNVYNYYHKIGEWLLYNEKNRLIRKSIYNFDSIIENLYFDSTYKMVELSKISDTVKYLEVAY